MVAMVSSTMTSRPELPPSRHAPVLAHEAVTTTLDEAENGRVFWAPHEAVVGETSSGVWTQREVSTVTLRETGEISAP